VNTIANMLANVAVGSKAVLTAPKTDFRSSPNNRHYGSEPPLPKTCTKGDVPNRRAIMRATNKETVAQF
jgi:hypothetical protein